MMRMALFTLAVMVVSASAAAQDVRIGYVDTRRIEAESVPFQRALDVLKREFAPREQQIRDLRTQIGADRERFEKERASLAPAELQARANALASAMRRSDQMAVALAEDLERRKREDLGKLVAEANSAVKAVAEAGKFDLVLQQATYIRPAIDITDQVLKEMARRSGAKP
jgi:outer membrane protein